MFLGLLDPDPLVRWMDPDPSIIKHSYCSQLFECVECGMKFSRKNSLGQHEKVHLGKYRCQTCAKCFGRPNYLANHRRVCQKALGIDTIGNLPCSPITFVHKVPSCHQCCGSGMFIRIPNFGFRIQTQQQKGGVEKKFVVIPFFVATNFTKLKIILFLKC
jgi:hypothetical protein